MSGGARSGVWAGDGGNASGEEDGGVRVELRAHTAARNDQQLRGAADAAPSSGQAGGREADARRYEEGRRPGELLLKSNNAASVGSAATLPYRIAVFFEWLGQMWACQ